MVFWLVFQPTCHSRRLQSVLNAAVRLILNLYVGHTTSSDALISLDWLRTPELDPLKIAVLFELLWAGAASYFGPLVRDANLPCLWALRSDNSTIGDRSPTRRLFTH